MAIAFISYFLIQLVISIVMIELTAKKPKSNLKAQGLDSIDFPTADASRSIPYFVGDCFLDAPNLTWYGDYRSAKVKKKVKSGMFSSSKVDIAIKYYIGMELSLSFGVVDQFKELWFGEKKAWEGTLTNYGTTEVKDPNFFGGEGAGGGIRANIIFYAGRPDQAPDPYMTKQQGGKAYNQKGICRLIWKGPSTIAATGTAVRPSAIVAERYGVSTAEAMSMMLAALTGKDVSRGSGEIGENPTPPPIKARMWRFPNNLSLGANRHIINNTANAAEAVYELMTGRYLPFYGEIASPHLTDADLDIESLRQAGITCFNEGIGVSFQWLQDGSIGAIVDDLLDQIGCVKREDPTTGKISFKMLRKDYDINDLRRFNSSNVSKLVNYGRQAISASTNKLVATYTDPLDQFKEKPCTVQSNASMWMTSNESPMNVDLTFLTDVNIVNRRAQQRLQQVVFPAATGTLTTDRRAWDVVTADCFVLDWEPDNISNMVCRISAVNRGNLGNNQIEITFIEDIFAVGSAVFSSPPPSAWVDPKNLAEPVTIYQVEESPYQLSLGVDPYRMLLWAFPPTLDTNRMNVYTSVSGGIFIEEYEGEAFSTPIPLLQDWSYGPGLDTRGLLHLDLTGVTTQLVKNAPVADIRDNQTNWINLAGEWIAIVDWNDLGDGDYQITSVYRGLLDTVPKDHLGGDLGYLIEDMVDVRETQFSLGAAWGFKLQTVTDLNVLDISATPVIGGVIQGRSNLPYAPGDFKINGVYYPEYISGPLVTTWTHRDRLTQPLLITNPAANYGPEAGVTYTLSLYNEAGTLVRPETGITGNSYSWDSEVADSGLLTAPKPWYDSTSLSVDFDMVPMPRINAKIEVFLESRRGALHSWQSYDHTVLRKGYGMHYGGLYGN